MDEEKYMSTERIEKLLVLFTKLFGILDITYEEFNKKFFVEGDKLKKLNALEKEFPELGLLSDRVNDKIDGVSVLSLFATITDVLIGVRFKVEFEGMGDHKIKSAGLYFHKEGEMLEKNAVPGSGYQPLPSDKEQKPPPQKP